MFTITLETDNSAFEENGTGDEIARILIALADKVAQGVRNGSTECGGNLRDLNGNTCGRWEYRNYEREAS